MTDYPRYNFGRRALLLATAGAALGGLVPAQANGVIRLRDLYDRDRSLSDLAEASLGSRLDVSGFMAPPLRAEADFFVLTKMPMSVCPFCETAAEWPSDIVAVYTKRTVRVVPFNMGLVVSGVLETGERRDPETGFVSMVRLVDATYG